VREREVSLEREEMAEKSGEEVRREVCWATVDED
jgi:hypothetical protein